MGLPRWSDGLGARGACAGPARGTTELSRCHLLNTGQVVHQSGHRTCRAGAGTPRPQFATQRGMRRSKKGDAKRRPSYATPTPCAGGSGSVGGVGVSRPDMCGVMARPQLGRCSRGDADIARWRPAQGRLTPTPPTESRTSHRTPTKTHFFSLANAAAMAEAA